MANELLKTLTIDGVSNDTMGVGDFLELDSNNNVKIPFEVIAEEYTVKVPSGTVVNKDLYTTTKAGLMITAYAVAFPTSATGVRYSALLLGGNSLAPTQRGMPATSGQTFQSGCGTVNSVAGKAFGIRLYQNSGSSMDVKVNFSFRVIPKTSV